MLKSPSRTLGVVAGWLGLAVLVELVLLRTGTRTLVHIPGLGDHEVSIGVLSEAGRIAYYLAAILVVVVLTFLASDRWTTGTSRGKATATLIGVFLMVSAVGRVGWVSSAVVAWVSVGVLIGLAIAMWQGVRSIPVILFVAASVAAALSTLGQGVGGGIPGQAVDILTLTAEALLILAGLTSPLLVTEGVPKSAYLAGGFVLALVAVGFSVGGSTLAILALWNLGVPGWFPPIAYGFAFAGLTVTLWTSVVGRDRFTAVGVVMMIGGGVGMISTYQTALAIVAVTLLTLAPSNVAGVGLAKTREEAPRQRLDQLASV